MLWANLGCLRFIAGMFRANKCFRPARTLFGWNLAKTWLKNAYMRQKLGIVNRGDKATQGYA